MNWNLATIAAAVGGQAHGDAAVSSVVTDSRSAQQGSLFVAIRGEHFDGHDFVPAAFEAGATAVLVESPSDVLPRVEVADSIQALIDLATYRRKSIAGPVVGITGSTGKTSTKDLLAGALGGRAWCSPKSYNNEVGVPLTILSAPDDTDVMVIEVGSRGTGHIHRLIPAVRPQVAVITSIGPSHLEMLGDVENVRKAKWELVTGLEPEGIAVLPAGDEILLDWAQRAGIETLTFGTEPGADVRAADIGLDGRARPHFTLFAGGAVFRLELLMAGKHQASNAAAAVAAGMAAGFDLGDLVAGVQTAIGSDWRMEVRPGRITVVNDAYNANPASMQAAFDSVAQIPGRRIAVLGMMAELGEQAVELHRQVGLAAVEAGFERVLVVGEDPGIAAGAGVIAIPVAGVAEAAAWLEHNLTDGDVVLVKASRSVGLESLAEELAK
jgi:UDP-N-acetylmuramoyl-tripeptide--D-alanyl-D-alanine ligase